MVTEPLKPTTSQAIYRNICQQPKYKSVRFIANVLFTSCGHRTARLRALQSLVDGGREVSPLGFVLPYDALYVDGKALETMPLLDEGREVPYTGPSTIPDSLKLTSPRS